MTSETFSENSRVVAHFLGQPRVCTVQSIDTESQTLRILDEQSNTPFTVKFSEIKETLGDIIVPYNSYPDFLLSKGIPVIFPDALKEQRRREKRLAREERDKNKRNQQFARMTDGMSRDEIVDLLLKLQEGSE